MLITGALCFWNERPEDLDACVRGLANIADRVIALDGAYVRYPNATPRSSDAEVAAIREAATAVGLGCLVLQPDRLWAGQIEKRSYLLSIAANTSAWVATVDADHVIKAKRDETREFLARHSGDIVAVPYVTPSNPERPLEDSAVGQWHVDQMAEAQYLPHLWRALPGMEVEKRHWWITGVKNGHRIWLWGGDDEYPHAEQHRLTRDYVIEHRTMYRTRQQIRDSRAFLNDRQRIVELTGQEDYRPGLPDPVWDYRPPQW